MRVQPVRNVSPSDFEDGASFAAACKASDERFYERAKKRAEKEKRGRSEYKFGGRVHELSMSSRQAAIAALSASWHELVHIGLFPRLCTC